MRLLLDLLALVRALSADRARLALENVVLRQQLNVLKRSVKRARINDGDRMFWVLMHRRPLLQAPMRSVCPETPTAAWVVSPD